MRKVHPDNDDVVSDSVSEPNHDILSSMHNIKLPGPSNASLKPNEDSGFQTEEDKFNSNEFPSDEKVNLESKSEQEVDKEDPSVTNEFSVPP